MMMCWISLIPDKESIDNDQKRKKNEEPFQKQSRVTLACYVITEKIRGAKMAAQWSHFHIYRMSPFGKWYLFAQAPLISQT